MLRRLRLLEKGREEDFLEQTGLNVRQRVYAWVEGASAREEAGLEDQQH